VRELERLLAACRGRADVRALFVAPEGTPPGWAATPLRERAASVPGVVVADDPGGVEALRFGAATSGTALLYGADGRLAFRGGITLARSHEGDNPGRDALTALLTGGRPGTIETPVFGCPLRSDATSNPPAQDPTVPGERPL
jgi:hypothetical protein